MFAWVSPLCIGKLKIYDLPECRLELLDRSIELVFKTLERERLRKFVARCARSAGHIVDQPFLERVDLIQRQVVQESL